MWDPSAGVREHAVVVTGAAGGIGRSVAEAFAVAGAHVVAVDIAAEGLAETVAGLEGGAARHQLVAFDLRDWHDHDSLFAAAQERFGRFDHLVHVAAVLVRRSEVDDVTEDDWDFQSDVNLKATFFLMRSAARSLRRTGRGGSITAFTSQGWATGGFGGSVAYCATKGGVVSMARGLARTYAPDGIRVNTIAPGAVNTAMMTDGMSADAIEAFVGQIPMGRMGRTEELAAPAVFLASDHASYITGATLNVSGGFLMY